MNDLADISGYIKRAIERVGLVREKYEDRKLPKSMANFLIIPFFGDMRAEFVLASFILPYYKLKNPNKYVIICSYPGHSSLYLAADEYWAMADRGTLAEMYARSNGFSNESVNSGTYERSLMRYFENVYSF